MLLNLPDTRIHIGVFLALVVVRRPCHWLFARTSFGTRLDVLGANPRAAVHMGIDVPRLIVVTFMISGALIGLAAAVDIAGYLRLHACRLEPRLRPQGRAARLPGPTQRARRDPVRGCSSACCPSVAPTRPAGPTCPSDFLLLLIGLMLLFMVVTQYLSDKRERGESLLPRRSAGSAGARCLTC